ncbi:MAG: DNA polymerase III subunit delta [Dehalococcoidia bacterium]
MISVFYGKNDFSIDAEISKIRLTVTPEEVREVNSLSLMENTVTKSEFLSAVLTVPFMANKRVVIVSNLISKLNSKKVLDDSEWSDIIEQLKLVPDSTDLIFREFDFDKRNYLFKKISNLCDIRHFPLLRPNELKQWVTDKVNNMGMTIDLKAVNLIVDFIGSDLRTIDSELNKLSLYSDEGLITESDVQVMVAYVKDQSIFRLVDLALEGRNNEALKITQILLNYGSSPNMIVRMMQRQLRLLLIASDLRKRNIKTSEFSQRLSLSGYPLQKTLEMERRFAFSKLLEIYNLILNSDIRVRSGLMTDVTSLDLLISEMAA